MVESIREEDRRLKTEKKVEKKDNKDKAKNKAATAEEKEIAETAAKEKLSKEEAKKKVAREAVKRETGYDAEALANVGRNALDAKDAIEKPAELRETTEKLGRLRGEKVRDMMGKIQDTSVAQKVVASGLGAMHLSTTSSGLNQGARVVLENEVRNGGAAGMEEMLRQAVLYGNGMTMNEVKELKMTPDRLKEYVQQLKENYDKKKKSDKNDLPFEAFKRGSVR